jgi:hypothetical protein
MDTRDTQAPGTQIWIWILWGTQASKRDANLDLVALFAGATTITVTGDGRVRHDDNRGDKAVAVMTAITGIKPLQADGDNKEKGDNAVAVMAATRGVAGATPFGNGDKRHCEDDADQVCCGCLTSQKGDKEWIKREREEAIF